MTTQTQPTTRKTLSVAPPKVRRRYRLLAGLHIEHPPTGEKDNLGTPILGEFVYHPGDILETDENLMERNSPNKPPKFAFADEPGATILTENSRVWDSERETLEQFVARMKQEGIAAAPNKPDLAGLTEKELRSLAAEYDIQIPKEAKTLPDVLRVLQTAFA